MDATFADILSASVLTCFKNKGFLATEAEVIFDARYRIRPEHFTQAATVVNISEHLGRTVKILNIDPKRLFSGQSAYMTLPDAKRVAAHLWALPVDPEKVFGGQVESADDLVTREESDVDCFFQAYRVNKNP